MSHLKIVVVALLASVTVIVVGIAARPHADKGMQATVYKPQKPIMATSEAGKDIRGSLLSE